MFYVGYGVCNKFIRRASNALARIQRPRVSFINWLALHLNLLRMHVNFAADRNGWGAIRWYFCARGHAVLIPRRRMRAALVSALRGPRRASGVRARCHEHSRHD